MTRLRQREACLHGVSYPSTLNSGKLTGSIPGVGIQRLAISVVRSPFVAEKEQVFVQHQILATPKLQGEEWPAIPAPAAWRAA